MEQKESKKTVRTFAIASFFNDMGSDMIYPIWPVFVTGVLKANMTVLGFIDGLGEALVSISQAVSGYLSDRIRKRKAFIWTGYLFGSISRVGYAFSTMWQWLVPFRILDRAGKIRNAPRDAMIADMSAKEELGKNFGLLRTMDYLGAVVGIIICVLFINYLGYRKLFLIAAIPSLISVLLVIFVIKDYFPAVKNETQTAGKKRISFEAVDKNLWLYIIASSIFALGSFSYSFLLVCAKTHGCKAVFIPVLYLIFTMVASIVSLPFGKLSDRVGRKPVIIASYILWILACVSFIFFSRGGIIVIAFVLYGLHRGALEPVQKAFVSQLSVPEHRASILGGFQLAVGMCALPASLVAGIIWDRVGVTAVFCFAAVTTIISIVLITFVKEKKAEVQ